MDKLTPRQRVLTAVNRQKPDKVPKDISWGLTPVVMDMFRKQTGKEDPEKYFDIEVRFVGLDIPPELVESENHKRRDLYRRYYPDLPAEIYAKTEVTEWGTAQVPGSFFHFVRLVAPLRSARTVEAITSFPLPDFQENWRLDHTRQRIEAFHQKDLAVCGAMAVTIFEVAWQQRGMEELFEDFTERPEMAHCLLDRLTDIRITQAEFFANQGVDVLILGDDVSMQTGMLMSPKTWRAWFKERMRQIIAAARAIQPDLPVFYHSDGNPAAIIPDLIEIGVTILNPVQPECIDPVWVKERYGDKLALWGTIGTQTIMPFGKPEEVKAEVKKRIETVGRDGGLLLGPTHMLEPDVPWENILALYEAIEEYGYY
jgi:uroporphyrinogen decarboxylase